VGGVGGSEGDGCRGWKEDIEEERGEEERLEWGEGGGVGGR